MSKWVYPLNPVKIFISNNLSWIVIIFNIDGHVIFILSLNLYLWLHWRFMPIKRSYYKRIWSFLYFKFFIFKNFIKHIIIKCTSPRNINCLVSLIFLIIIIIVFLLRILKWITMILNQIMSPLHCYFSFLFFINSLLMV